MLFTKLPVQIQTDCNNRCICNRRSNYVMHVMENWYPPSPHNDVLCAVCLAKLLFSLQTLCFPLVARWFATNASCIKCILAASVILIPDLLVGSMVVNVPVAGWVTNVAQGCRPEFILARARHHPDHPLVSSASAGAMYMKWFDGMGREAGIGNPKRARAKCIPGLPVVFGHPKVDATLVEAGRLP